MLWHAFGMSVACLMHLFGMFVAFELLRLISDMFWQCDKLRQAVTCDRLWKAVACCFE